MLSVPVLVSRAKNNDLKQDPLVRELKTLGMNPVHIPLVRQQACALIKPFPDPGMIHWLVFTSANTIAFFEHVTNIQSWTKADVKVAAVGPKTKNAAERAGFTVELSPTSTYTAETLSELLLREVRKGETVLLPLSRQARPVLTNTLEAHGIEVMKRVIYETIPNGGAKIELTDFLHEYPEGILTFTSPSSVHAFLSMHRIVHHPVACIGTVTANAAREAGFTSIHTAYPYTFPFLAQTVLKLAER